jgi:hypothetical protein
MQFRRGKNINVKLAMTSYKRESPSSSPPAAVVRVPISADIHWANSRSIFSAHMLVASETRDPTEHLLHAAIELRASSVIILA